MSFVAHLKILGASLNSWKYFKHPVLEKRDIEFIAH